MNITGTPTISIEFASTRWDGVELTKVALHEQASELARKYGDLSIKLSPAGEHALDPEGNPIYVASSQEAFDRILSVVRFYHRLTEARKQTVERRKGHPDNHEGRL